jgi:hypothetical protein
VALFTGLDFSRDMGIRWVRWGRRSRRAQWLLYDLELLMHEPLRPQASSQHSCLALDNLRCRYAQERALAAQMDLASEILLPLVLYSTRAADALVEKVGGLHMASYGNTFPTMRGLYCGPPNSTISSGPQVLALSVRDWALYWAGSAEMSTCEMKPCNRE